jgi:hypothetical protein
MDRCKTEYLVRHCGKEWTEEKWRRFHLGSWRVKETHVKLLLYFEMISLIETPLTVSKQSVLARGSYYFYDQGSD